MTARVALDTNVVLYAFKEDPRRDRSRLLLQERPVLSVQALNEFANVASKKLRFDWSEIERALEALRQLASKLIPLTDAITMSGLRLTRRYQLSFFDGLMVAAALEAECSTLLSEDMHHGLVVDGRLQVLNPFADA